MMATLAFSEFILVLQLNGFFWLNHYKEWECEISQVRSAYILNIIMYTLISANIHFKGNIFNTSWRRFEDVCKMYYQVKLFLLTRLQNAFNRFLRHYDDYLQIDLPKSRVWEIYYKGINFPRLSSAYTLLKKWSFPLKISSVNVTKTAVSCGFSHIYWSNP